MKYFVFLALFLSYSALSKTTAVMTGHIQCARNYGQAGFYVVSSADGNITTFYL